MKFSKEIIYHFTCEACSRWWSIALESDLKQKEVSWTCPWCSHVHDKEIDTNKYKKDTTQNLSEQYTNKYQHKDAPYDYGHQIGEDKD